ncbi:cell wall integrity and stress response component 3-like isoform X2 [Acanthaster planci]|nr:cell wall integrity and stress response component 3-like isoform X2 [Acanthaster planci]XP_022089709.1 cell wall integrity and stress response component 3-like isoform X2 [Acanthaster planci]XP_022089710.1 cell wall integrity and stress response component 3-like isoform X2 [Acanthaster planci]XP_022089711.1 cell wall integrity and stress response component 3-like isoform X2 [Acanthaster planci]
MTKQRGVMFAQPLRGLLWGMTFQLAVVLSEQANAPGYLGCFGDDYDRALPAGFGEDYYEQSVEWCFRYCLEGRSRQHKYAGLEYTTECYCGDNDNYDKHGRQPESDCQDKCPGNSDQICGDRWRLSVYRISQGVCSNDIGPPTNGDHTINNPRSLDYNLNNFKFFRTRVDFSCDVGYTLHGASSIECIDTGYNNVTWSDSVPTCQVPTTTSEFTTNVPTTTIPQSTVVDERGTLTAAGAPSLTRSSSKTPGTNNPNVGALKTEMIIGIAVGGAVLVALGLLAILLCVKKRKNSRQKDPAVAMATIGENFINNTYGLPEVVSQSMPEQSPPPIYSQVIKRKTDCDDLYATPDDVTSPVKEDSPENQSHNAGFVSLSRDQESGWVENSLYACESFPVEPEATINDSDGQTSTGPPQNMEEKSSWVENIIYE